MSSPTYQTQQRGILFYLVGASGSGKDSLIRGIRTHADQLAHPLLIAHRYITRAKSKDEDSVALSEAEFHLRQSRGLFSMSWQANGLSYGIGKEVELWLDQGCSVLVNGSRAYLDTAKERFSRGFHSILVDVSEDVLKQRLQARGRESHDQIEQRIARHLDLKRTTHCDSVLNNDQPLANSLDALMSLIHAVQTSDPT